MTQSCSHGQSTQPLYISVYLFMARKESLNECDTTWAPTPHLDLVYALSKISSYTILCKAFRHFDFLLPTSILAFSWFFSILSVNLLLTALPNRVVIINFHFWYSKIYTKNMNCNIHHEYNQPRCVYGVYAINISITNCHDGTWTC